MFKVEIELKAERIANAFIGAFEGASNYWMQEANLIERTGIGHSTITKRLAAGWSAERAVTAKVGPSGPAKKAKPRTQERKAA